VGPAALLAVLAALCVVVYGPVSLAQAHAQLIASDPADGARVTAVPAAVTLTFSDPIAAQFVRVQVATPAGAAPAGASTAGPRVTITLPDRGPGAYTVTYRVVSADGHPVSGTLAFTVSGAPTASVSAAAPASATASASAAAADPATSAASAAPAQPVTPDPLATPDGAGSRSTAVLLGAVVAAGAAVLGVRLLVQTAARRRREQR